jgi:WD40 repeat protein
MPTTTETDAQGNSHSKIPLNLMSSSNDDVNDSLLSIHFNQDGGCLAVGTSNGFRICNVYPFEETFRRTFAHSDLDDVNESDMCIGGGGISYIEMLFRCNLLAIVGGGPSPHYPPNKVMIWDDHIGRPIGELSFRQRVLAVKLRRDRICVALSDRIYVYNFGNLSLLDTIVTGGEKNGLGLLCISTDARVDSIPSLDSKSGMVLACPSVVTGQVRVELYGYRKTIFIDAHDSALSAMALSVDGVYLCTASEKGTIIRLFETGWRPRSLHVSKNDASIFVPSGTPLREFRRGMEPARITSLAISMDKRWVACTSDRATTHIFRTRLEDIHLLNYQEQEEEETNERDLDIKKEDSSASQSMLSLLPNMFKKSTKKLLLDGETSVTQIRGIQHPKVCAFVPDQPNMIAIAGLDEYGNGCLTLHTFGYEINHRPGIPDEDLTKAKDKQTMEAQKIGYHRFFKKNLLKKHRSLAIQKSLGGCTGDLTEFCDRALIIHDGIEEEKAITWTDADLDDFIHIETKET